ncbi:MAG: 1,4-dihydroxy-6-naphthoate synthase [Bacteroidia bacterium]|nr:1,4-dihydroxy-6-naphthoate synthase [Bacteroidia bacterium]
MKRVLTVAISPCPNDTFIWGAIALGYLRTPFAWEFRYEDIQTLNELAQTGEIDILKLSFFQYALLPRGLYRLLPVGAAMGYGVGPLLVARAPIPYDKLGDISIGIPGKHTTAYSLLRFFAPHAQHLVEMRYDALLPAVANNQIQAAVIIHESRFTYPSYGLVCLQDLGAYWTGQTGYPIPLGGIGIKRGVPRRPMVRLLRRSLHAAWKARVPLLSDYVAHHAQEMAPEVQLAHIRLYVNRYTYRLGPLGWKAIRYYIRWVRSWNRIQ